MSAGGPAPLDGGAFDGLMAALGPFEPCPHISVAVSGGADSLALAFLALGWAERRGGSVTGLVVDHGLRVGSDIEARLTCRRLEGLGITPVLLTLDDLVRGPGLAARAREARYGALDAACVAAGILHLLLGHHAADQAETLAKRMLDGSGPAGLACMAAVVEVSGLRRLRPLLGVAPGRLRATLRAAGLDWVEDPSNADPATQRSRLRALRGDRQGDGMLTRAATRICALRGRQRAEAEARIAAILAERARIYPEGYAVLSPGPIDVAAFGALLRMLAGGDHVPSESQLARLSATLRPATLGGVRIQAAGRLGAGHWLLTREAAAIAPPVPAREGVLWDGRFRLIGRPPEGAVLSALGRACDLPRGARRLPASVRETLPAVWQDGALVAAPHLGHYPHINKAGYTLVFQPVIPAAGAGFVACDAVSGYG